MAAPSDVEIRQATHEDTPFILSMIRELADFEHALSSVHATPELLSRTIAFEGQETSATRPARCLILTVPDTDASPADTSAASSIQVTEPIEPSTTTTTTITKNKSSPSTFLSNTSPSKPPPTHTTPSATTSPRRKTAALALYFYNFSTWLCTPGIYLEDLYVIPSERRKGHATRLLAHLARELLILGSSGGGGGGSAAIAAAAAADGSRTGSGTGPGRLEWSVLKWNANAIRFYEGETVGAKMMDEWVGMRVEGEEALRRLAGSGV